MFPQLHLYGLIIGAAIAVAYWQVESMIKKEKIDLSVDPVAFWTVLLGIVGARIYHLVTDWPLYVGAPFWQLLAVWNGGVGVIGALLGGGVGLWIGLKLQRKERKLFALLDILALSIPLSQAIGRWGNYVNHELFGLPTNLPWGIFIPMENRPLRLANFTHFHPLFLYESLLLLGIFIFLQRQHRSSGWQIGSQKFIGAYFMLYSAVRFCLEFLRVESARSGGVFSLISIAQWMMVGIMILGMVIFWHKKLISISIKAKNQL